MANSPHPETVTVSFTLPQSLATAVEQRAKASLTNKSDIIRRALLEFLSASERAVVMSAVMEDAPNPAIPKRKSVVSYRKGKKP
jgi:Arc/MetJ-type ribon-helix-helix transcriptional regulator